jgi:metal-responsive CopG/Arc/MetJ family transcriptional regulator
MARKPAKPKKDTMVIGVRFDVSSVERLDRWIAKQPGGLNRSQAVRWITEQWLSRNQREAA